jgi:predicted phage terminase large subunit-like protein
MKRIVMSLDSAFKTGTHADYSVIQVWGEGHLGFYLLHLWRGRVEYPELKRVILALAEQWKPNVVLIEDAASGQSLIQELRSTTSLPVKPLRVDRDKISRAEAVTPMWESGRVFVPASAPWLQDFTDELCAFPNGAHDDQVDACTQALNYLRGDSSGVLGLIEFLKNVAAGLIDGITGAVRPRDTSAPVLTLTAQSSREEVSKVRQADARLTFHPPTPAACEKCGAGCVAKCSGQWRCNACGHQWFAPGALLVDKPIKRSDVLAGRCAAKIFSQPRNPLH